jgi:hypothetical protein
MQKKPRTYFLAFLLLITAKSLISQQVATLDKFSVYESNGKVYLNWVISAGSTCNGTKILRSTDTLNFTEIGSITGVCGNITTPQPYSFTDENPVKNAFNFYKLLLGENGKSGIISIEVINIGPAVYQVRPQPVTNISRLYFSNPQQQQFELRVYNLSGKLVLSQYTTNKFFELSSNLSGNGLFVFIIRSQDNKSLIQGRFLVIQ